ncbi:MAG: DUF2933 domain-containing protein [Rhodospirillales bacterium]|nr:DUF2933 domain-containing protein [Rhodospirillales bacterium]
MNEHGEHERGQPPARGFLRSRAGITLIVFIGVGAFLLAYEHRAHIPGSVWLLLGLLGLCVLMHVFMHSRHGGHGGDGPREGGNR